VAVRLDSNVTIFVRSILEKKVARIPLEDDTEIHPMGSEMDRYLISMPTGYDPDQTIAHWESMGLTAFDSDINSGRVWKDFVVFSLWAIPQGPDKPCHCEYWPLRNTSCNWLDFEYAKKHNFEKIRHVLDVAE
jgi:hypothetical protein